MTTIETMQALVDALEHARKAANARGFDLLENSSPQKYWYKLRDQADAAIDAGRDLLSRSPQAVQEPIVCDCGDSITPNSGAKCGACVQADSVPLPVQEPASVRMLTEAEAMDAYADPGKHKDFPLWMERINAVQRAFAAANNLTVKD